MNHNYSSDHMGTETKFPMQKRVIVYMGEEEGYLGALSLTRNRGGLPDHVLHDDALVRSGDWQLLQKQRYYNARVREIYVYPEKDGRFRRGVDVVDAFPDKMGRRWRLPLSAIPYDAFEAEKPSLFVDPGIEPERIRITDKEVVIAEPVSVTLITPSIQVSGQAGRVDEATRMPLYVDDASRDRLKWEETRLLFRIDGAGVRPLGRACSYGACRHDVDAFNRPDAMFGVGWVGVIPTEPWQVAIKKAPDWLVALLRAADAAEVGLPEFTAGRMESVESVQTLIKCVRKLDVKE